MTVELVLLSRVSYRDQEITRPRLRNLLALLADDLRAGCGTARLVAALWPDERPENPAKALQVLVSHARARFGADLIEGTPIGYRLALRGEQVDASALLLSASASARHALAGDHAAALEHAEAGIALWDGPASWEVDLADHADPLSGLRAARASTYRSLVRARALALSRLGRRAEALEPLTELMVEHPRDEEVLAELLVCEADAVGPSAALARYDAYRRALRDELGSDPGAALQEVHQQLLRSDLPAVRHGIPHEPNPLLGRDEDVAAVANLLRSSRVTSIVGPGGLGKTRLAHVVSRQAEQRVGYFVPLAGVTTDEDVVGEVVAVLGVGDAGRPGRAIPADVLTGIVGALGPGPALLVLDNCEHVVRGAAELVGTLVSRCAELRVLTTSRAPLGLSSESVYLLPELRLETAVELFGQRARAARPTVDLPTDVVREVCAHLDGLPLAVELAAARVRVMSVAEIARRLEDRFALLRGGARDAPARHHALYTVIDWSWHLLDPTGQAAMRALSVFPGGFTADAAGYLLDDSDPLRVVEQLVDQSLVKVTDTGSGTRFRMLETVREFSTARQAEAGETDAVTDRFLGWARDFGVAHHESIFGADLVAFVERIRAEQDNLVQALRHGLDRGDGATVAATAAALGGLWTVESNLARMATLAGEIAWTLSHVRPEPALVEATRTAAVLAAVSAFLVQRTSAARSLATLRRLPQAPANTLPRALDIVLRADRSALPALCDSDDPLLAGLASGLTSYAREGDNDPDGALRAAQRMLAAFASQPIPWLRVTAHSRIGELCLELDRGDEALPHLKATLPLLTDLRAWSSLARVRWAIVLANLQCRDVDEAEHWLEQTVRTGGEETAGLALFDVGVRAEIQLGRGDVEAGLRSWRQVVERLRDTDGATMPWALEARAVTVTAHARHGRLDLVDEIAGDLPHLLSRVLTSPAVGMPICGGLLLAQAMVDLQRGAVRSGARLVALAERFRFVRGFQPTMSAASARTAAHRADEPAYTEAVSAYAGLGQDDLRAAALKALRAHR